MPPTTWDALGTGHAFASHCWYRYGQVALCGQHPFYVQVHHDDRPMAQASLWLTRNEPLLMGNGIAYRILRQAIQRWPLLVCRTPVCDQNGLMLPQGMAERSAALTCITQAAQAIARDHNVSFILFDYMPSGTQLAGTYELEVPDPDTVLANQWPDFDTYLESLSKSTRRNYRQHLKQAEQNGIRIEQRQNCPQLDRAVALIHAVYAQHDSHPAQYLRCALEHAEQVGAVWSLAYCEGQLVGCNLLFMDSGYAAMQYLGLDYSVAGAYFPLMYAALRRAIESGAHTIYGGSGAYEFKRRLGFAPTNSNHTCVLPLHPALKAVAGAMLGRATTHSSTVMHD